jgi:hypothetical protein
MLVDDTARFRVKFWILFAQFSPNSGYQTVFFPIILGAVSDVTLLSVVPCISNSVTVSHILKIKHSHVTVP